MTEEDDGVVNTLTRFLMEITVAAFLPSDVVFLFVESRGLTAVLAVASGINTRSVVLVCSVTRSEGECRSLVARLKKSRFVDHCSTVFGGVDSPVTHPNDGFWVIIGLVFWL